MVPGKSSNGPRPHLTDDRLLRLAALGLCAAEILHEFAAPLTILLGRLEYMQHPNAPPLDETTREHVESMYDHAKRLKFLVEQLRRALADGLDLTALIHPTPDDLTSVVRAAVKTAQTLNGSGPIRFEETYADLPPCAFDRRWLWHAVVNLLRNAQEAIPGAGTITVRTAWRSAESVEISIADTGAGLTSEQLRTFFTPLATTKGANGSGIGLACCHEIVRAHGGRLEVATTPGHGTTVRIVLPTGYAGAPILGTQPAGNPTHAG